MKVKVAFLRHAKVPSHKGDMPITEDSRSDIEAAVPRLRILGKEGDQFLFLATRTKRSAQTAEALRAAIAPDSPSVQPAWALRNPDIYLAGSRVEMGSTSEFFASQCEHLSMQADQVLKHPFYKGFLTAPDRIEYWVHHSSPPGECAADVAQRVLHFARSLRDPECNNDLVVACVTHSPVMRALLTKGLTISDPGEPGWLEEILLTVSSSGVSFRFRDAAGTL